MSAPSTPMESREVAVIGSLDFIAGFALAGVRNAIEAGSGTGGASSARQEVADAIKKCAASQAGILIIQEDLLAGFSAREKEKLLDTPSPIVMFISERQEITLQSTIKKALGIDIGTMLKSTRE